MVEGEIETVLIIGEFTTLAGKEAHHAVDPLSRIVARHPQRFFVSLGEGSEVRSLSIRRIWRSGWTLDNFAFYNLERSPQISCRRKISLKLLSITVKSNDPLRWIVIGSSVGTSGAVSACSQSCMSEEIGAIMPGARGITLATSRARPGPAPLIILCASWRLAARQFDHPRHRPSPISRRLAPC